MALGGGKFFSINKYLFIRYIPYNSKQLSQLIYAIKRFKGLNILAAYDRILTERTLLLGIHFGVSRIVN